MKCDSKTMLTVAAVVTLAAALAYFTLPAAQAFILASAPVLVALICPVVMLLMMKGMHGDRKDQARETDEPKQQPRIGAAARDEG
jgi:hypothetical protein